MTGLSPLVRRGTTAAGPYLTEITPEAAGWAYSGLRIVELDAGGKVELATGPDEVIILPLSGAATVDCDGQHFALHGRRDVFDRVSDFAYLPRDSDAVALLGRRRSVRAALRPGQRSGWRPVTSPSGTRFRSSWPAAGRRACRSTTSAPRGRSRPIG